MIGAIAWRGRRSGTGHGHGGTSRRADRRRDQNRKEGIHPRTRELGARIRGWGRHRYPQGRPPSGFDQHAITFALTAPRQTSGGLSALFDATPVFGVAGNGHLGSGDAFTRSLTWASAMRGEEPCGCDGYHDRTPRSIHMIGQPRSFNLAGYFVDFVHDDRPPMGHQADASNVDKAAFRHGSHLSGCPAINRGPRSGPVSVCSIISPGMFGVATSVDLASCQCWNRSEDGRGAAA